MSGCQNIYLCLTVCFNLTSIKSVTCYTLGTDIDFGITADMQKAVGISSVT